MGNIRRKINRIAPFVISAAMLITLSAAVYGLDGGYGSGLMSEDDEPVDSGDEPVTDSEGEDTSDPTDTTTPDISSEDTTPPPVSPPTETDPPPITDDTPPEESDTDEPPVVLKPEMYVSFTERWLTVGDGVQLDARVINTDEHYFVSFTSSNTNVVRVDASGYIIAVGAGSAVVTASSGEIEAYVNIYVTKPEVKPEILVLTENSFILKTDQTARIQARLLPEDAAAGYTITYTSNDTSVAVVDENGVITAVGEGMTTITVEGAGLRETVQVTVSSDIAYDTARLDGYLYDGKGKPMAGNHLTIDGLSAVTDKNGYFLFESVEQRSLTIRLADDSGAYCGLTVSGDMRVYLLYDDGVLTRMSSYEELVGRLAINSVKFISTNIVLTEGEVYELAYQYEPSNAPLTGIVYTSSNTIAATVGQLDGVVTAKSPGETTITLILNDGQAQAVCTITVNPKESSEHSVLILLAEGTVFAGGAAAVLISYRKYKRKVGEGDGDEEEEDELHDID